MRYALVLAPLLLAGCVGSDDDLAVLQITANEDHAHCASLLMRPGDLVYVQCRLALRKTYLQDYAARKSALQTQAGFVSDKVDIALRNDTFCNYDESVKASMETPDPDQAATTSYFACETTRLELAQTLTDEIGIDGRQYLLAEQPLILRQNANAVAEAQSVVNGPYV